MHNIIVRASDKTAWDSYVTASFSFDFYHCNSYHLLSTDGEGVLFIAADEEDNFICFPLLIRAIPGEKLFDCTSVYGYAGPLSNKRFEELSPELVTYFHQSLSDFFRKQHIVAAFSRLHPVIDQSALMEGLGHCTTLNKTVALDLRQPPDVQRRKFRKSTKSEINQLRKKGYVVRKAESEEEVLEFVSIYNETMSRVSAVNYYFFDEAYFINFLNSDDFRSELLVAYKDGIMTAGAIFTYTGSIMQYHLAGTRQAYIADAPMKVILDEARLKGTECSMQFLHLGGGVGGSDDDSLFRFKSGFSDLFFNFKVWKYVVDQERYDALVEKREKIKAINPAYFPLYRS